MITPKKRNKQRRQILSERFRIMSQQRSLSPQLQLFFVSVTKNKTKQKIIKQNAIVLVAISRLDTYRSMSYNCVASK